MSFPPARRIALPEVTLSVHEAGTGPAVVLCHGFPELAYSWRHQVQALAAAGFRVIAPNQRGYADSDSPDEIEAFDLVHLTDDMVALLDALDVEAVAALGGRLSVEPLLESLFTAPPRSRRAIIHGLGYLGDRRATPRLIKMLEFSQEEEDRLSAIEALGMLGDPRAVEALGRAAEAGGDVGKRARLILDGLDV